MRGAVVQVLCGYAVLVASCLLALKGEVLLAYGPFLCGLLMVFGSLARLRA